MLRKLLLASLLVSACGKDRGKVPDSTVNDLDKLNSLYASELDRAKSLRDPETGWITRADCDAMIWSGKYAAADGVDGVAIEAAQYGTLGKWGRRPPPWCWTAEGGDQGSKTEWSRDMAVGGLFPWAWRTARLDVVQNHINYGRSKNWQMGEPLADGRTVYTPAMIGVLYKMQAALGGEYKPQAAWPDVYPSGLTDYQAHLQVMSIWLQGEIATVLSDAEARPRQRSSLVATTEISGTMFDRLAEHAAREPRCPLYQAVHGTYSGDMQPAVDALRDPDWTCEYMRCSELEKCRLGDWLFAASIALDALP